MRTSSKMTTPLCVGPTVGTNCRGKVTADVLMRELDYGAFATSVRGKRTSQRKRNAILYSFRPREISSGKNPTCYLWLGFIPLLTGSHRRVADSLTVVSSRSEFRYPGVISNLESSLVSAGSLLWSLQKAYSRGSLLCESLL